MAVMVFNDESQIDSIYVAHLHEANSKQKNEPKSPNHCDKLTYDGFVTSVDALIEPFSKVVEAQYAD